MRSWKTLALIFILVLSFYTVSAQGLGDANLTVEESLVYFVTNILGFPVTSAADVILYVIGPIIAFYFLIVNFATEGYNDFQKRLERREYYEPDEDLPTGMKVFSLITSFITVVTIGRIAPSLILLIGSLALLLGILMFLGLLNFGGNNNDNGDGTADAGGNNGSNESGGENRGSDASRGDYIERVSDAAESATSGALNHLERKERKAIGESLRYFDSDFLGEYEKLRNDLPDIRNNKNKAIEQHKTREDTEPDKFNKLNSRARICHQKAKDYWNLMDNEDPSSTSLNYMPRGNANDSNLCIKIEEDKSNNDDIFRQVLALDEQLDRTLSDSPRIIKDTFDETMSDVGILLAVGHFILHHPNFGELNTSDDYAEATLEVAESMGLARVTQSNINKLKNLADPGVANDIKKLVKELEGLCKSEIKLNEAQIQALEAIVGKDKVAYNKIDEMLTGLSSNGSKMDDYHSPLSKTYLSDHKTRLQKSRAAIKEDITPKIRSLENRLDSNKEFESNVYKSLKKLEEKI